MIASEPTDTYMDLVEKYWLGCRMAGALTVQLEQQDPYNEKGLTTTLDGEVVVSGARGVGHGAGMFSVKDVDRRPTQARDPGQGGSQESRASTIDRLIALVVCTPETMVGRAHENLESRSLISP